MDQLTVILLAIVEGVLIGIMVYLFQRSLRKRDQRAEKKEKEEQKRRQEQCEKEELMLNLLISTAKLSYANAIALRDGKTNGETKEAIDKYDKTLEEFREFERKQISKI